MFMNCSRLKYESAPPWKENRFSVLARCSNFEAFPGPYKKTMLLLNFTVHRSQPRLAIMNSGLLVLIIIMGAERPIRFSPAVEGMRSPNIGHVDQTISRQKTLGFNSQTCSFKGGLELKTVTFKLLGLYNPMQLSINYCPYDAGQQRKV